MNDLSIPAYGIFFVTMILMFAIGLCIGIVFILLCGLLIGISAVLGLQDGNVASIIIYSLIVLIFVIISCTGILWIGIRFYLVDVPLAIEDDVNGSSTINRSWELTKGNVGRILLISLIGFLITIPIQFIIQIVTTIIGLIFTTLLKEGDPIFSTIFFLYYGLSFVGGALILPFWQTVKAVVYYDLRSRHEGLGLQLRDYDI